jgi:hypothetical protein
MEAKKETDNAVPPDHELVCLTFGPTLFGGEEGRAARDLRDCEASVHFKPPVAVDSHWRSDLGTFAIDKLEKTRLAIVASGPPQVGAPSEEISKFRTWLENHAYNALRGILMQGSPFELIVAGLEIRRTLDAGRMRESASFMRPRTAHPWERILRIDDSVLDTAAVVTHTINAIFATANLFERLKRGLDHWDRATMEHRLDLRLHALVPALEALLAPDRGNTQNQFVDRCKLFATIPNADRVLNEIYELRSQVEHSNDWRLAFHESRPSLSGDDAEALAVLRCYQAELIARAAFLRVLVGPNLLERFANDESIREFWRDIQGRTPLWGAPLKLVSEERRTLNVREKLAFEEAKAIDANS